MPGARAELIDGVVYVASPVFKDHSKPHWLGTFDDTTDEYEVLVEHSVRLDADTEVQPDALVRKLDRGTSTYSPEGFIEGAPELAVEVSMSSVSCDLHGKLRAYQDAGVQEYIVWRVRDGELDWFELRGGQYVKLGPDESGVIESRIIPGLKLWVPALLAGRTVAVSDHLLGRIEALTED